ncbi:MAG: transketolase [bacterium]
MSNIAQYAINTIRTLSIDAVQKANSGHPGAPMGLAPAAYTIWKKHLRHNPANPHWANRDRFVLSNGHASMLLYSLLHLTGYEAMTMEQIQNFRQWGSITPGHPEVGMTPGVETTTGPLGQGLSTAIGMAMAEAQLNAKYDGKIDHYTYGICSDGDLMEGVTAEASSLAGHLGLGKLIFLFDDNHITIDGTTEISFTEDVLKRYEAYGWHVDRVNDGNDFDAIDQAIQRAKAVTDKPSMIAVRTVIGFGSPNKAGKSSSHGSPLGWDEIKATKAALGWPHEEPFFVPAEVAEHLDARADGAAHEAAWLQSIEGYDKKDELLRRMSGALPANWSDCLPKFEPSEKGMATRASGGKVIAKIYEALPELTGGSADLAGSTKTLHEQFGVMDRHRFDGQNVHFGIREHAMAAIANGMTLHGGVRGFGSTFLVFADYMRPALRIAALSHIPSLMVFTHDSIGLGEDGPTHQPVEHLASLRAIPNYVTLRPADANEVSECWKVAIEHTHGPVALVLTRQDVPTYDRSQNGAFGDATRGAYVIADSPNPELILIATGSEVDPSFQAWKQLTADGVRARLVSMPSWEVFAAQDADWRERVLPRAVTKRLAVEAGIAMGWERWVGFDGDVVAMKSFGASAPSEVLFEKFGFSADNIAARAKALLA